MNDLINIIIALCTLTILEIVLGIDNLIILTILTHKLPPQQQNKARKIGLTLAWSTRLLLLACAVAMTKLTDTVITIYNTSFSWRDLFLLTGGIFLLYKATQEIHAEIEPRDQQVLKSKIKSFTMVVLQIAILDIVFSLDSVLTAIGLTNQFWLMATAISLAILVMLYGSAKFSRFIQRHPTIKMLALSFVMMIGVLLIADGFKFHVPRTYIYFAMGFSLFVEFLNMIKRKRADKWI